MAWPWVAGSACGTEITSNHTHSIASIANLRTGCETEKKQRLCEP